MISRTDALLGLVLMLCISLLPRVAAQTYEWQHLFEGDEHVVLLAIATGTVLTTAGATALFRSVVQKPTTGPKFPDNKDVDGATYLLNFLNSEWMHDQYKLGTQNLPDLIDKVRSHPGDWYVPENFAPTREQQQKAVKGLFTSIALSLRTAAAGQKMADELSQSRKDAKKFDFQPLKDIVSPNVKFTEPMTAATLAADISNALLSDLSKIWDSFPPSFRGPDTFANITDLQRAVDTLSMSTGRMSIVHDIPQTDIDDIWALLPSNVPGINLQRPPDSLTALKIDLKAVITALCGRACPGGAHLDPTEFGLAWDILPIAFRTGRNRPGNFDDLKDELRNFVQINTAIPRPMSTACNHPPELATNIDCDPSQDWADSLTIVRTLMTYRPALVDVLGQDAATTWADALGHVRRLVNGAIVPVINTARRVFKGSEIKELTNRSEYPDWKLVTYPFLQANFVEPRSIINSLETVLSRCTGEVAPIVQNWNRAEIIDDDWYGTLRNMWAKFDRFFLPRNYLDLVTAKWVGLRLKNDDDPQDALARFEVARLRRNMALLAAKPPLEQMTEAEVCTKLLQIIPTQLRTILKNHIDVNHSTYDELRDNVEKFWTNNQKDIAHKNFKTEPRAAKGADPVPQSSTNGSPKPFTLPDSCAHHLHRDQCPKELKGPLGPWDSAARLTKIAALQQRGLCLTCRGELNPSPMSTPTTSPSLRSPSPGTITVANRQPRRNQQAAPQPDPIEEEVD